MSFETLDWKIKDGIGIITIARPEAGNAFNRQMGREYLDIANICGESKEVRVILLRSTGKIFSAGGDIKSFVAAGDRLPILIKELTTDLHAAISRFARIDAPMICAVQGTAAGVGFSVACAADIVIAARGAKFTMAYTGIGFTPDGSASWYLPRLIGMRRTQELMLTNRVLSAEEALDWGLITTVVENDELDQTALELAAKLNDGPTAAFGNVKSLLLTTFANGLETQMENETQAVKNSAAGAEGREGISAFIEKRKPKFRV